MEFFENAVAVKLKTHLDKYLVADDDQVSVRQSHSSGGTRRARWLIEHVDSNSHVIRLKSCYGRYLTSSNTPFLLGMTGKKVVQTLQPENSKELAIEWQPLRDGFQVKLKASGGTYLRANGAMVPWRNTVTHDSSFTSSNHNWILFDVEAVDVPEDEEFDDYMAMVTSFSSVSDHELSGLEFGGGSPAVSIKSSFSFSPRTPILLSLINKTRLSFQDKTAAATTTKKKPTTLLGVMDLFLNAKAVRLKNHHNKYLHAEDDEESVSQDRNGASKNNRWTVEFVTSQDDDHNHNHPTIIRLKSCYNKYLTASNQPFLLGMTGRKVLQTVPRRLDSSVEWEPVREGNQVKLRTRYGQYLRANGGLPPWRNSVTHDVPHRTATQEWVLWDVDVVDIVVQSPAARPPPPLVNNSDSFSSITSEEAENYSGSTSPTTNFVQQQPQSTTTSTSDWHHGSSNISSPPKLEEGRTIYYHVVSEDFGEMDENAQGFAITFKGNNVTELTQKLEEETGLKDITVCTRSPLNGKLYPLRLQLPPNNVTMKVVVVQNSYFDSDAMDDV